MRQALSDVRVVELATGFAASWCGKAFADLGADVVKVEPPQGDALRSDRGAFAHLNTNKRSVVVEPAPSAADALWQILEGADLVIEAPGLGGLHDWDIDRGDVLARQPATSVVAITGFGATGPYAAYAWSDLVAQAYSGALLADRREPVRLPISVAGGAVGHPAAEGGLAAVLRARSTGAGAFVDCAATEVLAATPNRIAQHLAWEYRNRVDKEPVVADSTSTLLPLGIFPCG